MKRQVIIVLGGSINKDGTPTKNLASRLDTAIECYRKRLSRIIVSGKGSKKIKEADSMKRYLLKKEIPAKDVLIEDKSMDTIGNFYFTRKRYLDRYKWKEFIVVTSAFHMARTKIIARWVLGKGFKPKFVSASDRFLSKNHAKRRRKIERLLLSYSRKNIFIHAKPGNKKQIGNYLLKKDPMHMGIETKEHEKLQKETRKAQES